MAKYYPETAHTFSEYLPHGEYGIHTIESIVIHEVVKTTNLWANSIVS